jgi:hypothetical protein
MLNQFNEPAAKVKYQTSFRPFLIFKLFAFPASQPAASQHSQTARSAMLFVQNNTRFGRNF